MNPRHRHTARRTAKAVLLLVALGTAWAAWATLRPSTVAHESIAAHGVIAAPALPEEYRAIEPAGTDGSLPSIPVSEMWPAQR